MQLTKDRPSIGTTSFLIVPNIRSKNIFVFCVMIILGHLYKEKKQPTVQMIMFSVRPRLTSVKLNSLDWLGTALVSEHPFAAAREKIVHVNLRKLVFDNNIPKEVLNYF
ncbi:hypothetical protein RF11_00207 [Thelohanellus kitauei]|uniref:Uncharacterized protein n=1 Tax=Thelohanellus kitauei TaxID=669202 RepID=A0A0C2NLP7_THEKT|nr:hypothetical protein RF11_00207 [Thelohanellus kitauei]